MEINQQGICIRNGIIYRSNAQKNVFPFITIIITIRDHEQVTYTENNGKKRVMSLPELPFLVSRHYTVRVGEELIFF